MYTSTFHVLLPAVVPVCPLLHAGEKIPLISIQVTRKQLQNIRSQVFMKLRAVNSYGLILAARNKLHSRKAAFFFSHPHVL